MWVHREPWQFCRKVTGFRWLKRTILDVFLDLTWRHFIHPATDSVIVVMATVNPQLLPGLFLSLFLSTSHPNQLDWFELFLPLFKKHHQHVHFLRLSAVSSRPSAWTLPSMILPHLDPCPYLNLPVPDPNALLSAHPCTKDLVHFILILSP